MQCGGKPKVTQSVSDQVKTILTAHGQLPVDPFTLDDNTDLYAAGLKSFAVVQVMLALEGAFDVEFPESMLVRRTFASVSAIETAVNELVSEKEAVQ